MSKNAKLIADILSHLSLQQAAYHPPKVSFYYFEAWNITYQTPGKVVWSVNYLIAMCRLTHDDFAKNAAAASRQVEVTTVPTIHTYQLND